MADTIMPAEHAILGLLDLEGGRSHGYDLSRYLAKGQPLANVMHLEPGMLYHHLKKIERRGWVESTLEPQPTRPTRQVYQITDAGRGELRRWLTEPVTHTREIRLEFLVKLYFARRLDRAQAESLMRGQLDACRKWESKLIERETDLAETDLVDSDRTFSQNVLDLRLAQTRAAILWLESLA